MAKLVPSAVQEVDTAAEMSHRFAEWLSSVTLFPNDATRAMSVYTCVPGDARMGKALDRALSKLKGDQPRSSSVLKAQLRQIAEDDFASGCTESSHYVLAPSDTYEVAMDFPTGAGIDDEYDWMSMVTYAMVTTAVGSLGIYGDLVNVLGDRFIETISLRAGGVFDQLAKTVETALPKDDCNLYVNLDKEETAVEFTALLRRVLPIPDEMAVLNDTRVSAHE